MTKRQQINLVRHTWSYLCDTLDHIKIEPYGTRLFHIALAGEREHRRFCPDGITPGLSATDGAKYFCVKFLAEYALTPKHKPELRDYLSIRPDAFLAAALTENYGHEIRSAFSALRFQWDEFEKIDYAELMKPNTP